MARPRQFDENQVLDAAARCFWSNGYEATSTRDLAKSMGITCASLYNAFGDKASLYRQALRHYVENGFSARSRRLEEGLPPAQAIVAFFDEIVALSLDDDEHKGCMVVNSAVEPRDADCAAAVVEVQRDIEAFFLRLVVAGQQAGTISRRLTPEDLARHLLCSLMGLRVLSRSRPEPDLLRGATRTTLALLVPEDDES